MSEILCEWLNEEVKLSRSVGEWGGPLPCEGAGARGGSRLARQRGGLPPGQAVEPPGDPKGPPGPAPADLPTNPPASTRPDTSSGTFLILMCETVIFEAKLVFLKVQVLSGDTKSSSFIC